MAIFIAGCGVWNNFTTYFNLYYNTTQLFNEAESEILAQRTDLFSLATPPLNTSANQKLQSVVEKCSNILQFKSDSRYVDDALLILGKTFYYQQNYLKSERELEELLAIQEDSDLRLEAQLWLGKCQMKLEDFKTGLQTFESVKKTAADNDENEILTSVLIEEIKYKVATNDYNDAIKSSQEFLKVSDNDAINSKVAFELGKLYEIVNDEESAAKSYGEVLDYSPSYDMEFNSKIAYGVALRKAGQKDEAFSLFDDMSSQDKYKDVFDQINYQKGATLASLGNYEDALNILIQVDTTFKNTQYAGVARFEIGKLYEHNLNNFDSAYAYYLKAKSALIPPEYLDSLAKKVNKFKKYSDLRNDLAFSKTELKYALSPDEFVNDSIAYSKMRDSVQQLNKRFLDNSNITVDQSIQKQGDSRSKINPGIVTTSQMTEALQILQMKPPVMPAISADSIKNKIVFAEYELGNLFFTDFNVLDSAYYFYSDILKNYPESYYKSKTLFVLGNLYITWGDSVKADSIFKFIYDNYKNDHIVNAAAKILNKPLVNFEYDPASDIYKKAESELNKKNYYSTIAQLNNIYDNYPKSSSAPKALYTKGWIFENIFNKPDSAAIIYDSLSSKYPSSVYANKVATKLGYYRDEKRSIKKAIQDSLDAIQKAKEQVNINDTAKTTQVSPVGEKQKEIKEGIIPPEGREFIKDSTSGNDHLLPRDSLLIKRRREIMRDELLLKDSLIGNHKKLLEDSTKIK